MKGRCYSKDAVRLGFVHPSIMAMVLGGVSAVAGTALMFLGNLFLQMQVDAGWLGDLFAVPVRLCGYGYAVGFALAVACLAVSVAAVFHDTDSAQIARMVRRRLFLYKNGNPLQLKEGELLPKVKCEEVDKGCFKLDISATSVSVDELEKCSSVISSALLGKFKGYAVTVSHADMSNNGVTFIIADVTYSRAIVAQSVEDLKPDIPTKLLVQNGTSVDLTTSGSMLFAGKTRSGKTTGVISLLIGILLLGRDKLGSVVKIIDPKNAELSQLPHTVTPDEDGGGRAILETLHEFENTMRKRQATLNNLSKKKGDAVKWWDAKMHPSILFVDEFVACRSLFPTKAVKEEPGYSIKEFDDSLKRIITMGASAGCFVIVSIAEASVGEGGLPTMLKNALTTKVLFKPTPDEGRHIWDGEKLKAFPERAYSAGDAWFSSTDGLHDDVAFVHFPVMEFPVYRELGRLMEAYYGDSCRHAAGAFAHRRRPCAKNR